VGVAVRDGGEARKHVQARETIIGGIRAYAYDHLSSGIPFPLLLFFS
jgi:hypothetical protein